jgi:hypothetical protein
MKKLLFTLSIILTGVLMAFTKMAGPADVDKAAANKPILPPYNALVQIIEVNDYQKWLRTMYANAEGLHNQGLEGPSFARAMDDTNRLTVFYTLTNTGNSNIAKARELLKSDDFQKLMRNSGVTGNAQSELVHVVYDLNSIMEQKRLFITQHVKNYKAWKKAFEAGKPARVASGLVDRLIARDIDDTHKVIVYLGVKNLAQAKTYVASGAFKNFCDQAGLDKQPEIAWYTWINYKGWYYDNPNNN